MAIVANEQHGRAEYPADHQAGMRVPKGGSDCQKCRFLGSDRKTCTNQNFIRWNGSNLIPAPIDEYCSDWFEPRQWKSMKGES